MIFDERMMEKFTKTCDHFLTYAGQHVSFSMLIILNFVAYVYRLLWP